jgi:hypothetical protein
VAPGRALPEHVVDAGDDRFTTIIAMLLRRRASGLRGQPAGEHRDTMDSGHPEKRQLCGSSEHEPQKAANARLEPWQHHGECLRGTLGAMTHEACADPIPGSPAPAHR